MTYRSFTATYQASLAFLRERPMPDRLAKLGLPVLVIFGSRDRRWQPSSAEDYRRIPQARIALLDVGHTRRFEDPDTTGATCMLVSSPHSTDAVMVAYGRCCRNARRRWPPHPER
jgi:pimeloyl-ACP methyl ester carboxylesterase